MPRPPADRPIQAPSDVTTHFVGEERRVGASRQARVPVLTILGHADAARVGERSTLTQLAAGREVLLSRLEPSFSAPDGGAARPLAEFHLSREPLRLMRDRRTGSVTLTLGASRTSVVARGAPVEGELTFTDAELDRGVTLTLGQRVVLLLHRLPVPIPPASRQYGLVGASQAMTRLRQEIGRAAELELPTLIRGETGTGKELVARAIHDASPRAGRPFLAVNTGALSPALAAAELFGAVRGAYTGAGRERTGLFRAAHRGTLFLDEIGEIPPEIQVLLLRVLENREILPVGSAEPRQVDVRVLAATDADLEAAIRDGRFRAPLYHRLAGFVVGVPPLRERRDDIPRLLHHFLEHDPAGAQGSVEEDRRQWPPPDLVVRLVDEAWPGNVRQLRNVARILATVDRSDPEALGSALDRLLDSERSEGAPEPEAETAAPSPPVSPASKERPAKPALHRAPKDLDDTELLAALRANGWRIKPAAAQLRISRTSLYALIDRCPLIRRAGDFERDELEASFEQHGGDLQAMSADLEVSLPGLRQRLQELGIGTW